MSTLNGTPLEAWIEDLRGRLDRGEMRRTPLIESQVSYLLLLTDSWQDAPAAEQRQSAAIRARRQIAEQLTELHAHLVLGEPGPAISDEFRR